MTPPYGDYNIVRGGKNVALPFKRPDRVGLKVEKKRKKKKDRIGLIRDKRF